MTTVSVATTLVTVAGLVAGQATAMTVAVDPVGTMVVVVATSPTMVGMATVEDPIIVEGRITMAVVGTIQVAVATTLVSVEWVNLSKRGGRTGFSKGWQGCSEEQPCQPEENPILPDSFTQIYILFLIGFRIGPPKMH